MKKKKNYFFKAFLSIVIALCIFYIAKQILPSNLFKADQDLSDNVIVDSMAILAMQNQNSNDTLVAPDQTQEIIPSSKYTQGYTHLIPFFSKLYDLESSKKGKIRIAYFGDSMTDGDLIVKDIRKSFQDLFGGEGVGFVGITSLSSASRATVTHRYSPNWTTKSFLDSKGSLFSMGIDGQVSYLGAGQSAWLQLNAGNEPHLNKLYNPNLIYGTSTNSKAQISVVADGEIYKYDLAADLPINETKLTPNAVKNLKINFNGCENIPFYGVNIDNEDGVYVDNFSMRGNSGLPLAALNKSLMNSLDSILHYDLIIVHYGANLLGYKSKDFGWYEVKMYNAIQHIKECFVDANILIISTADKSSKYGTEMETNQSVEPLIKAQNDYAKATNSAFINLFALMGGSNSMIEWVKATPPLANKDYTHFNAKGSEKVAHLLSDEIKYGYHQFKALKQQGKIK